jgi:hypothetical protein
MHLSVRGCLMSSDRHSRNFVPDSWRLCRGPANWFTFRCPDEIEVRQNQTLIELRMRDPYPLAQSAADDAVDTAATKSGDSDAGDFRTILSLVTWWDETGADASRRPTPDLTLLFPQVVSLLPQPSLPISVPNEVWSGSSRRPRTGCWLSRVFGRKPGYQWRLWTIRRGRLTLVATMQSPDRMALDPALVRVCEQILCSLEIAESPAWPPDVFLKHVIELARHHFPLLQSSVARGFSLRLGQSEIGLSNFYRMYLQQPDQFRRIVLPGLTTVVRLQELSPEQLVPSLDHVRARILPMLAAEDEQRSDERVRTPWVGGLTVGYVVDEDDSYRYVHQQMLDNWDLSVDDLHDLAISNLRQYAADHPLEVTMMGDETDPRMLMPVRPDAYNCSRILDPGFHGRLRDLFGHELIVGVPNRDFFVAVSLKDADLIEQVRTRVNEDFATMHHPLTRRLLVISADGVSEYCEN